MYYKKFTDIHGRPVVEIDDKYKPIATLILDKIIRNAYMMNAHRNSEWYSNEFPYPTSVLNRIKKLTYHKCMHDIGNIDSEEFNWEPPLKGEEYYDHGITCYWKEPKGKGISEEKVGCLKTCYDQGPNGNWYAPCDFLFHITLWHPDSQAGPDQFQESYYYGRNNHIVYKPYYNYTSEEVTETLKILCEIFEWEFEQQTNSRYHYIS